MARLVAMPSLRSPYNSLSLFALLTILLLIADCWGQNPPPGLPLDSLQIPVPLGSINPLSDNVHFEIPIGSIPQRGNAMILKLVYDTQYLFLIGQQFGFGPGWRLVFGSEKHLSVTSTTSTGPCPDPAYPNGGAYTTSNYAVIDSYGTYHYATSGLYVYHIVCTDNSGSPDPNTGSPSSGNSGDTGYEGYNFTVSNYTNVDVSDVNGMHASGPLGNDLDTNGNYFPPNGPLHDMFNRTALSTDPDTGNRCLGWNPPPTGPLHLYVQASNGSMGTYTVNCQQYSISQTGNSSQTRWLMSSLVLPDGTSYSFNYDSGTSGNHFGTLSSVTLPTGGGLSFNWTCTGNVNFPCDLNSATFGGGTSNFSYTKLNGVPTSTTVTGPPRYDSASGTNIRDNAVYSVSVSGSIATRTIQRYSGSGTLLKTTSRSFDASNFTNTITTTLNDTGQSSKIQYSGVPRARPTKIQEWEYGSSTPTRTTKYSYGLFNKPTSMSVWAGDGTSGSPLSQTTYTYDEYTANYCKNGVPMLASITGTTYHDDTNYGVGYTTRGNVTSISRWVSGSTWVTSHRCYDTLGNVTQEVDEAGHPTSYDYSENWTDTSCIQAGTITHGYPTTVTDAVGNRSKTKYYTCTGLAQAKQDENDITAARVGTTYTYDFAERPLSVNYPDGGQTSYSYSDTSVPPFSTATKLITTSSSMSTKTVVDGYGRVTQTQLTTDPEGVDYTDTAYDALGRTASVSNPYRSTTDPTYGITNYSYDALGRTTLVGEPDGSTLATGYSGNTTTVTDETGKKKKSQADAFGRLTAVWEDPTSVNYETDYTYDVLGNLLCSQQQGGVSTPSGTGCAYAASGDASSPWRIRRFAYDGLSRLTSTSNPESGSISYTYYADGPVQTKTAPLPNQTGTATVTTTYTYDADHRLTQKAYSDTTPSVKFGFDGIALTGCTTAPPGLTDSNPKGYRTAMCDASGGTSWSHDPMGRIKQERRTIGAAKGDYETDVYNLDGSISKLTALGYTIAYTYTGAGRVITAKNNADPFNYVTSANYAPFGGLTGMTMGSKPITVSNSYNNRFQPVVLSAGTTAATIISLSYDFHSATHTDNGNVFQIVNNRDNNRTQNFTYDTLNRIQTAYTNGPNWGESFGSTTTPGGVPATAGIDAWGNLWQRSAITGKTKYESLNCPANSKNQLTTCSVVPDAAGNVMSYGTAAYTYDAENRLIATAGTSYLYDGDGKRVEKCTQGAPGKCATNATGTLYWTGSGIDPLVETDLAGNVVSTYIFFGGRRIARRDVSGTSFNVYYYFSDHLGTHALITDANGTMPPLKEADYYPYGGEIQISGSDTNHYKFTGKERDGETCGPNSTCLDYFVARDFASAFGRFLSVDPSNAGADSSDPQSWNAYAYVSNNPLNLTDPNGEMKCPDGSEADVCVVSGPPPDVQTTSIAFDTFIQIRNSLENASQQVLDMLHRLRNWAAAPRDMNCLSAATSNTAAVGMTGGAALGLLGGPGAVVSVPTASGIGFLGGGGVGWVGGMINCKTGGDSGGGGGGSGSTAQRMTNQEAKEAAKKLGYDREVKDPGFDSHGNKVFTNGKNFITADRDVHSGGAWKMFDSFGNRLGTFDSNLTRIGN